MNIYTSYFAKVKQLQESGFSNLVCVAGYAPKFFYDTPNARFYPDLAPKRCWWRVWHDKFKDNLNSTESIEWYTNIYCDTVLSKLNPEKVVEDLGDNAVMLCYEKPGDFCHRHIIADWLHKNTGIEVKEVSLINNQ